MATEHAHAKTSSWVATFLMIIGTCLLAAGVAGELIWLGVAGIVVGIVGAIMAKAVNIMEDTK